MTEQDWLGNNQLSLDIWNKKYRVNQESFEDWLTRVSGGDEDVKQLIREKKFLLEVEHYLIEEFLTVVLIPIVTQRDIFQIL